VRPWRGAVKEQKVTNGLPSPTRVKGAEVVMEGLHLIPNVPEVLLGMDGTISVVQDGGVE